MCIAYKAEHAEINTYGDIGICILLWK